MKKILHISKYFYPQEGGIEIVCRNIVESQPDFQHMVLCFNSESETISENIRGIDIKRVSTILKIASQPISTHYFKEFRQTLHEFKPDLIHFHAPNPLIMLYTLLLKPKRTKLIVHWHSDIVEQKVLYLFVKNLESLFLRKADTIFITSENYLLGSDPLTDVRHKTKIIPCAIEPDNLTIEPSEMDDYAKLQKEYSNKKIVFSIGRHVTYKGLKYLIEAEKYIQNDCIILIAGTGPLTKELKESCHSNRIHFLGRLSNTELKYYLHMADVFAFPSITKNEAFGVVLAEAMYCKTPAVTFKIEGSGVNWVCIDKVTGLEVKNKDYQAFGAAIDRLLSNEGYKSELGENARKRVVENFTMEIIGPIIKKEYISLLND
jgi:glycosyltransferase involved in cell wall biosynthesis